MPLKLCFLIWFSQKFKERAKRALCNFFSLIRISNISHWGKKTAIYPKIHIFQVSFFTKFTILKSHMSQNSQFQSHIFDKIHNFKILFFTKFAFSKLHLSQNSHFSSIKFSIGFAPEYEKETVCESLKIARYARMQ